MIVHFRIRFDRIFLIVTLFVSSLILLGCYGIAPTAVSKSPAVRVFYAGPDERQRGAFEALKIAETEGFVTLVSEPNRADVFFLNGVIPDGIAHFITGGGRAGTGLGARPD